MALPLLELAAVIIFCLIGSAVGALILGSSVVFYAATGVCSMLPLGIGLTALTVFLFWHYWKRWRALSRSGGS